MSVSFTVTPEEDGRTLKEIFRRRELSHRLISRAKRIGEGITVNGSPARTIDRVRQGDTVSVPEEDKSSLSPSPELLVPVLYEDSEVIVFDKPAGMPVHPSNDHRSDTLGNFFAAAYPGKTFRPVSRLDRFTSGCVLTAKSRYAAAALSGKYEKHYTAVCCGRPQKDKGIISAPIARAEGSVILRCVRDDGKQALTEYEVISSNGRYTLLSVVPVTGRTHQIRVHFSFISCPLAGDSMYGGSTEDIDRQALHCSRLVFTSPADGVTHTVISPLPADIAALAAPKGSFLL
ncbi:MAG: RluA family pseudouridine synthase [Ruminococcus sp.]|nr:RluA family pseudouridine synthase [Ruminococcus sp.]